MRGTTVTRRALALSLAAIMGAGLAGCAGSPDSGGDFSAQRETVTAFMTALERGDAQQASTYLSDTTSFAREAMTDEFYAKAVEHPADARISVATDIDDKVAVQVDFRLGDDDRELNLMLDQADPPRIEQWSGVPTILRSGGGDGRLVISGALTLDLGAESTYASLLPARYSVAFSGSATADDVDAFDLDFPVSPEATDARLPDGVSFAGGALEFGR